MKTSCYSMLSLCSNLDSEQMLSCEDEALDRTPGQSPDSRMGSTLSASTRLSPKRFALPPPASECCVLETAQAPHAVDTESHATEFISSMQRDEATTLCPSEGHDQGESPPGCPSHETWKIQ